MKKKILSLYIALALGGCAREQVVYRYRPLPVPKGLTQIVQKPVKPNPKTATQKDIGIFLIEQNAAIDSCNAKLMTIEQWSKRNGHSR